MILNKRQLSVAKNGIETLRNRIDELSTSNDVFDTMQIHAWECRIEDLTKEIEEFQFLENAFELEFSKEDLLKTIISLRIASGKTQKDLAEAIMVQEQQIQRYEQDYYRTASFERIVQILRELSKEICLKIELKKEKVIIKKEKTIPSFLFIKEQYSSIDLVRKTIQDRKTLMKVFN